MNNERLTWINSVGGPLILIEKRLVLAWHGNSVPAEANSPSNNVYQTDYDRACAVHDYLGVIPVAHGEALVLGDEPMQTAWIALSEQEGLLVRWQWATDESSVVKALRGLAAQSWETEDFVFSTETSDLMIFDAAFAGDEIDTNRPVTLSPGVHSLDTGYCRPDDETSLILHRLRRKM